MGRRVKKTPHPCRSGVRRKNVPRFHPACMECRGAVAEGAQRDFMPLVTFCNGKAPARSSRAAREWYSRRVSQVPSTKTGPSLSAAVRVLLRPCHFNEETIAPNRGPVKRQSGQNERKKSGKSIFTVYSQCIHDLALFTGYDTHRFRDESERDHPPKPIPLLSLSNTFATHTTHTQKAPAVWPGLFGAWEHKKRGPAGRRSSQGYRIYLPG